MKKTLFLSLSAMFIFWLVCLFSYDKNLLANSLLRVPKASAVQSSTQPVNLSVTVTDYLNFLISSGGNINLGDLNPQTANCNSSGTVFMVSTNAANGYKMTPSDGFATSSALVHDDDSTPIVDYAGTVSIPTIWNLATQYGLGVTLWSGSTAVAAPWSVAGGAPADACVVASTKWAGVPANGTAASGLTRTGPVTGIDYSKWGWKVNVANTQKTGVYAGTVIFTVVNVLS